MTNAQRGVNHPHCIFMLAIFIVAWGCTGTFQIQCRGHKQWACIAEGTLQDADETVRNLRTKQTHCYVRLDLKLQLSNYYPSVSINYFSMEYIMKVIVRYYFNIILRKRKTTGKMADPAGLTKSGTIISFSKTFILIKGFFMPRDQRLGAHIVLSCLSFCKSETLTLLITE